MDGVATGTGRNYDDCHPGKKETKEERRRRDRHKHAIMSFRPPDDLRDVIVSLAKTERRSVAQVVQILVEEALTQRGPWTAEQEGV